VKLDLPTGLQVFMLAAFIGFLAAANKVAVVPGYGMPVAQAQHKVRELYDALTRRGVEVKFGIHPVAGRMPGHRSVPLAEADFPCDKLLDMDEVNGDFRQTDLALIIGANDLTSPAARTDPSSPVYGMPVLDVDPLDRSLVRFADAQGVAGNRVRELSGAGHN
jgi:H+-translocating NAD(P) transhydrogenase subunit beta